MIRLGRWQRAIIRRALASQTGLVFPLGKREIEARNALLRRKLLVPAPSLPGAYQIPTERLRIHLNGSVLQHREDARVIHYNGPISHTPGQLACATQDAQALSERWQATDCLACKASLVGLVVERVPTTGGASAERFTVATVEPYKVGLTWSDDPDEVPTSQRINAFDLPGAWVVVL